MSLQPEDAVEDLPAQPDRLDIRQIVLFARVPGGDVQLVETAEGEYVLLHNDLPVKNAAWRLSQVESAAAAFRELLARLRPE